MTTNKKIQLVNNLLPEMYFNKLTHLFEHEHKEGGDLLNWFWSGSSVHLGTPQADNHFMFVHLLWDIKLGKTSNYFEMFEPILYFIDKYSPVKRVRRMKLNLYTNQNKKIIHGNHRDLTEEPYKPTPNITICVLNFTECNGGTIINNKGYPSRANQGLIFSNDLFHQGYVQTDTPRRIVLNIATANK